MEYWGIFCIFLIRNNEKQPIMGKYKTIIKTSAAYLRDAACCEKESEAVDVEELRSDLADLQGTVENISDDLGELSATVTAKKGVAVADSATAAGADYDQAQVQSILTELRALKTSLKNGGIIA